MVKVYIALFLAFCFVSDAMAASGKLTVIQNAKKPKDKKITVDLNNGRDVWVNIWADQTLIAVSATSETQETYVEINGHVRSPKNQSRTAVKLEYTVQSEDTVIIPNFFDQKTFRMKVEILDNHGNRWTVREMWFNLK